MTDFIAALPMYDWPEVRAETDALWTRIRTALRGAGIDAPETLTRDQPDLQTLWRAPNLIFAQACWGPLGQGLADHVQVIGQPDYSDFEGGDGALYSSAILVRHSDDGLAKESVGLADRLRDRRLAYNSTDSMSGYLALQSDLGVENAGLDILSECVETGGHRASIVAVAEGRADVCAIDCRSWALAQRHEPAAAELVSVAWTSKRKGLPYITSKCAMKDDLPTIRRALARAGLIVG